MKDELMSKSAVEALLNLVDVIEEADPKGEIVSLSTEKTDSLVDIAKKSKELDQAKKEETQNKYVKRRKRNQKSVEQLSESAKDIERAHEVFKAPKNKDNENER